jgi:hypothetical protein
MLDPLVPAAAYGAVLALAGLLRRRRALESLRPWQRAAKKAGLRDIEAHAPLFRVPHLVGRDLAHRQVHIERHENQRRHEVTRVLVAGNSGISLHAARWITTGERRREIELGDERFDDHVWVHGPPEIVRALLDAETRDIVRRLLGGRLELPGRRPLAVSDVAMANGELSVTLVEHTTPPSVHKLEEAIETLLELAQRLERPPEVASRLAANLEHEPQWRVRLRGLELLATNYPNDPATIAAMRHGLRDRHAAVQLQAAVALGEEGRDTLLAIAAGDVDDDSARAIELLGERLPAELALSLLRQALQTGRVATADASLRALGRVTSAEAGELLSKVLASESGRLALAAAYALGERGAPDGEPALLAALQRDEPDLLIPVAEALGRCGSAHAVLPLMEVAEVANPELRRAAEKSVAMIQSRLIGTEPGQLTLTDLRSGELSLADDDPRGRLSLPAAPAQGGE